MDKKKHGTKKQRIRYLELERKARQAYAASIIKGVGLADIACFLTHEEETEIFKLDAAIFGDLLQWEKGGL